MHILLHMFYNAIFCLLFTLQCCSEVRRQFNHYQEFLQKQQEEQELFLRQSNSSRNTGRYQRRQRIYAGPPRNVYYNPTYGFEPYWKTGDWVFHRNRTNETENEMCGQKCFRVYKDYGPICAVNKNDVFRNFSDICEMRNADCFHVQGWWVVYKGPCRSWIEHYPYPGTHFSYTREPITRALDIIARFYNRSPIPYRRHMPTDRSRAVTTLYNYKAKFHQAKIKAPHGIQKAKRNFRLLRSEKHETRSK